MTGIFGGAMRHKLELSNLRLLVTKDGDTYSDGELYYQLLINDKIVSSNAECIIVADGARRYLGSATVEVPASSIKVELRIDELDCTKDDSAQCMRMIDLGDFGASSEHSLRAVGAEGRLDCTITFAIKKAAAAIRPASP